ncbi:MAG: hypothetical protein AAF376_07065 [Pseudomonadota bacterium]
MNEMMRKLLETGEYCPPERLSEGIAAMAGAIAPASPDRRLERRVGDLEKALKGAQRVLIQQSTSIRDLRRKLEEMEDKQ